MSTFERVRALLARVLHIDEARITPQSRLGELASASAVMFSHVPAGGNFVDDLRADSLALIEITMALEEEFVFAISEADSDRLLRRETTVAELVDWIERNRRGP